MKTISRITQSKNKRSFPLLSRASTMCLIMSFLTLLTLQGCDLFGEKVEPTIEGCMELVALNFDSRATVNDGSCSYSTASFYAKFRTFSGIPITSIDVTINNSQEGTITSFYPNGPGNCSAEGTVQYAFKSGEAVDWNTTVYLANGATILNSGRLSPGRTQECLRVSVTR